METLFLSCAIIGVTLLLCQFLLGLLGLGGHHDIGGHDVDGHDFHDAGGQDDAGSHDGHHETTHDGLSSWFVGMLTLRTIVAALAFFGLAGMAGLSQGLGETVSLVVAVAAGGGAMFLVATLMKTMSRLKSDGTVRIERAVGKNGTVYLSVPGQKAGVGKVTLTLQNRSVEYQALTSHETLPTGAKIVVVGIISSDTVEVAPVPAAERMSHV